MWKRIEEKGITILCTSLLPKRFYSKPLNNDELNNDELNNDELNNDELNNDELNNDELNNDELVLKEFVNRNPRSMELLRIGRKPQGFSLDTPTINYYYRLGFNRNNKYLECYVAHNSGRKVVSASSQEWAIRKHLYSAIDSNAARNLGRILSRRCLQAGVLEMHTDLRPLAESSSRVKQFLEAVQEGGIKLEESPQIRERETYTFIHKSPIFPWEVTEDEVDVLDTNSHKGKGKDSDQDKGEKEKS